MKAASIKHFILGSLLLSLFTGCTHMVKMTIAPTTLPPAEKIPRRTALILDDALGAYKHEFRLMGDKWVYPFGPALKDYARSVSESSFESVEVVNSFDKAVASSTTDLILMPRAVKAENSVGVWAWDKINFTLVIEWTAKDRASQNTIWLKTITADASETGGNAFTGSKHQRILMQKLFDDLSLKTQDAFQHSPELRGK